MRRTAARCARQSELLAAVWHDLADGRKSPAELGEHLDEVRAEPLIDDLAIFIEPKRQHQRRLDAPCGRLLHEEPRSPLRAANVVGPHVVSPITSYFRLPVIPTVIGHDPRLQFLHEEDLFDVLRHSAVADVAGTFNVAGDGVLMLSQAVRRLQRPWMPMPAADFSPEQIGFLTYGRGVDTTAMRSVLGFEPRFTSEEAFADFGALLPVTGGRTDRVLGGLARALPSGAGRG